MDNTNKNPIIGKKYFEYRDMVIKLTKALSTYLKGNMKELEEGIPTIKIKIKRETNNNFGFGTIKGLWRCEYCGYDNKNA